MPNSRAAINLPERKQDTSFSECQERLLVIQTRPRMGHPAVYQPPKPATRVQVRVEDLIQRRTWEKSFSAEGLVPIFFTIGHSHLV
jgi:hypothetical protein